VSELTEDVHRDLRPLMFSVAYGMLGSVTEAEDVAQEASLRLHREADRIDSPAAFAVTVTTRLAIDQLRSARRRREVYVGAWLPEPLVTPNPTARLEAAERLSMAFLVLLERLSPVERAVLLLREVFEYSYDRIAEIVGKSEPACRQILVRARGHIRDGRPRFTTTRSQRDALAAQFFAACQRGDVAGLEALLAADISLTGDGGGKAAALAAPATGRTRVARFVVGLFRQAVRVGARLEPADVNGSPGARVYGPDGALVSIFCLEIDGDHVTRIYNQLNPDKLAHLDPSFR
jgi:RNA polymerase sigma-70 factor (TIGR02957 family)